MTPSEKKARNVAKKWILLATNIICEDYTCYACYGRFSSRYGRQDFDD